MNSNVQLRFSGAARDRNTVYSMTPASIGSRIPFSFDSIDNSVNRGNTTLIVQ